MPEEQNTPWGQLNPGEAHPAAYDARRWLAEQDPAELLMWSEAFASCAIEGNRLAEVCGETLRRLLNGEPVSDRYLLGLAWNIRDGMGLNKKACKPLRRKSKRAST